MKEETVELSVTNILEERFVPVCSLWPWLTLCVLEPSPFPRKLAQPEICYSRDHILSSRGPQFPSSFPWLTLRWINSSVLGFSDYSFGPRNGAQTGTSGKHVPTHQTFQSFSSEAGGTRGQRHELFSLNSFWTRVWCGRRCSTASFPQLCELSGHPLLPLGISFLLCSFDYFLIILLFA